jgi:hypothetical protein
LASARPSSEGMVLREIQRQLSADGTVRRAAGGDRIDLAQSGCTLRRASSQDFLARQGKEIEICFANEADPTAAQSRQSWQSRG